MSHERDTGSPRSVSPLEPAFWDAVEREVAEIDWNDFVDFLEADELSLPVREEFREQLRVRLREFVRRRHSG